LVDNQVVAMKIILLGVLLTIVQASSPIPQQAEESVRIPETITVSVTSGWRDNLTLFCTGALVAIGTYGVLMAKRSLGVLEAQGRTMQGQLIAMQRPKLQVKWVFVIPDKSITNRPEDGHNWRVGCLVANVGESKAEVVVSDLTIPDVGVDTLNSRFPPDSVPLYDKKHSFGTFSIQPGERKEVMVTLDANSDEVRRFRIAHTVSAVSADKRGISPVSETSPIICIGFFQYNDGNGVARMTGFAWQWNKRDMSFSRFDHPNYEYTD
jgi:hypothetical protein